VTLGEDVQKLCAAFGGALDLESDLIQGSHMPVTTMS
jgi:hypothetical protein